MTKTKAWLAISHHSAFRCGGWAYVTTGGGAFSGAVGGERRVAGPRTAMLAVEALLRSLAKSGEAGVGVSLHIADPELLRLMGALAAPGTRPAGDASAAQEIYRGEDAALWTRLGEARTRSGLSVVPLLPPAGRIEDFIAAWAETARDKAKATGGFAATIPKVNFARLKDVT
ncbi:MAG: hypothetical protein WA840_18505 [Caulobacteraceae bacterium]